MREVLNIGSLQVPGKALLAPMAGVTDLAFRRLLRDLDCPMAYTEFVSADGIVRSGKGSLKLLRTASWDHPLGVQIFGHDSQTIADAARIVEDRTGCDVLDLNMGCWVPKVIKRGAGAALLKDPQKVEEIIRAVVDAVSIPVTAKIRAGWCSAEINAPEVARAIEAGGASLITLHARTRSQRHSGTPDWSLIAHLKSVVSIPVVGNGGIQTAQDVVRMLSETGCDAVMVARAALSNPWIFRQVEDLRAGREMRVPTCEERLEMVRKLISYEIDLDGEERHAVVALRSQLIRFTAGLRGAAAFRRQIDQVDSMKTALEAMAPVFEAALTPVQELGEEKRVA